MAELSGQHFDQPGDDAIASIPLADRLRSQHLDRLKYGTDSTAVAVDMKAFRNNLQPAMDALGEELSETLKSNAKFKEAISTARNAAKISDNGDLIDLGIFVTQLMSQTPAESSVHLALEATLTGLEKSLLTKRTGQQFPLSGLSLHTQPKSHRANTISEAPSQPFGQHLPPGWLKFAELAF